MRSEQLRKIFLEFFKDKKHTIVKSDNLVPHKDPSLLFTTAGMVQFKPLWIGAFLPYSRATSIQKCLRAGGKGSDLENVGKTLRHHTFFEMLGNFSFGDYFKKEAIEFAWEFVTQVLKIDKNRLWISVYNKDDDALNIWNKHIGFPLDHIVKLGEKDNFWGPAGSTGACGPCSELYIDLGKEYGCGKPDCKVGCDCERYLEFWNLVFPEFDQSENGLRKPLNRAGIDTGMGLERLSFIMQNVKNNYETDLFKPIIKEIEKILNLKYTNDNCQGFHVIADHVRALTFTLSENIMPSNEGRGYVLRKILRRGYRFGAKLGVKDSFIYKLVPIVVNIFKDTYPELKEQEKNVSKIIKIEEDNFKDTLNSCSNILEEILNNSKKEKIIKGQDAFKLYDTYGLPLDMLEDIANENNFKIEPDKFKELMENQKQKSKASWYLDKGAGEMIPLYNKLLGKHGKTEFVGYRDINFLDAKVLNVFQDKIVLDKTPCYAESGGQTGDTGKIYNKDFEAEIIDTIKYIPEIISHKIKVIKGFIGKNEEVKVNILVDKDKRQKTACNHTATHILHNVLREVLGESVKQAGSYVCPDYLRFDFTHFSAISKEELDKIEFLVNKKIFENSNVCVTEKTIDEAKKENVIALFGEKYGDIVRVVDIGKYSKELCGGTHVKSTGEIGLFKITDECSIASGTRRIEAVTGISAYEILKSKENKIRDLLNITKINEDKLVEKVSDLINKLKENEKEIKEIKQKSALENINDFLKDTVIKNNIKIIAKKIDIKDVNIIKNLIDNICKKNNDVLVVFGSEINDKAVFISGASKNLVLSGIHAGKIVCEVAKKAGGSGGGRPDFGQAGAKDASMIEQALEIVYKLV